MSMTKVASLVTAPWLRHQLTSGAKHIKVLDASWTALKSGREDFLSKHLPSATFFDLNQCVKATPTLPRNLPEPACFEDHVQSLGINKDSHLIVYDRGSMLAAARTWWTFRAYGHDDVSVLDGGLNKWEADGHKTEDGDVKSEKGNFKANMNESLIQNYEQIMELAKNRSSQIIDARKPDHFFGKETEPTQATIKALQGMKQEVCKRMSRGRIPGATNMLEDLLLNPDTKCLLPKEELEKLFKELGVDLSKPITTMCYNGHAATLLALATHVCGKKDTSVYFGSWTEWAQRAPHDMVIGPATTIAHGG